MDIESKDKLINFINKTKCDGCHFLVKNYMDEELINYTVHYAFRLFRNYKGYKFKDKIHEQINNDIVEVKNKFSKEDIILHHYGYLESVTKEKNKRERNIPIILETLKENPNDSFQLFNLGNEYLSNNEIEKALEYYNKSYKYADITMMYSPHLLYRMSLCYKSLKLYELALKYTNEALNLYSPNVDFLYLKGLIYEKFNKPTMAIRAFNECIKIGDFKNSIKFIENCGSTKPLISLGDIYYDLNDYEMALVNYTEAINKDSKLTYLLYKIGSCLNKIYEDKSIVTINLFKYFSDKTLFTNRILLSEILLEEGLYNEARTVINETIYPNNSKDQYYLNGVLDFYDKNYIDSLSKFTKIIELNLLSPNIISNIESKSYEYIFLSSLLIENYDISNSIKLIKNENNNIKHKLYTSLYEIHFNNFTNEIKENTNITLLYLEKILSKVLIIKEYDLFENLIEILNYIDDKSVLITLSKIYDKVNLKDLSVKYVLKSIKELDLIDYDGINILYKEIR